MPAKRARGEELLDRPDVDASLAEASYRFMHRVNRWFGGIRPVRRFLAQEVGAADAARPFHVLDVGAGDCAMPIVLSRWARKQGLNVRFTCVDVCDYAAEAARRSLADAGDDRIEFRHEDVLELPREERYDGIVASMFLHHFPDEGVLDVVTRLRGLTGGPIFINDLARSTLNIVGCWLLTRGWHPGVKHDGMLSVRRGFLASELRRLLAKVPQAQVEVGSLFPGRVWAVIR